jgi:UDP-N-acetylmuramoylalanine--D-glutamate ligase
MLRQPSGLQEVMGVSDISLRGEHNLRNVLAACALGAVLELPAEAMRAGVIGFSGVEHRLEFVRELNGVQWYNDSKATSPGMSVTAMHGFTEPLIVLAGGRDKDLPWDEFARQAGRQTRKVIAFGEAGELVAAALRAEAVSHEVVPGLAQAVEAAALAARDGDAVVLAPGGTSFDEFEDYEHRGRFFKQLVLALPEKEQSP